MKNVHIGIVVRSFLPYKYKCIILDQQLGKIEGVFAGKFHHHQMGHGLLMSYVPVQAGECYFLETIDFIKLPAAWVQQDLPFFHHFLELLQEFVQYGQPCQNLFNLVQLLYEGFFNGGNEQLGPERLFKKWFLCRFFFELGLYPDEHEIFSADCKQIISLSFDGLLAAHAQGLVDEAEMAHWLQCCIAAHVQTNGLRTVFL